MVGPDKKGKKMMENKRFGTTIIKYNKNIQSKINISILNYKYFNGNYIIYETKLKGKEYYNIRQIKGIHSVLLTVLLPKFFRIKKLFESFYNLSNMVW